MPHSHNHRHREILGACEPNDRWCHPPQECPKGAPYLGIEEVSVDHSPLDVVEVSVVLQCALQEASLFTELGDVCPIIMSKHLISKNGICNL